MKIELRNVRYHAGMSEETPCFEAVIYIDGVKACRVSNHGTGGPHDFGDRAVEQRLDDYGKTLPPLKCETMTLEMDAELIVGQLLDQWIVLRDFRRDLRGAILFTKADGKLYTLKPRDKARMPTLLAQVAAKEVAPDAVAILNLLPEPEAVALYRKAAA